jgi:O-antigen/teichoic acid export membrane protein
MMPGQNQTESRSLTGHMVYGSFWMIAMRWAIRLTGVVSTIILARLLTPADFGIVAIAMIFVGMLELLNQSGQKLLIIRHLAPTREHYDTCWTISVLVGLVIAVAIVVLAPFTSWYFHDVRVVPVMQCLALRSALGGLENIGVTDFRRDLQFDKFFLYNVYPKLITFVITIALAFALRNYWALVAGIISSVLVSVVLSFVMHPYRPRFSLVKLNEVWSFSYWTSIRTIGWYLNIQVDQLAVGGIAGAASMGRYSVATDVAMIPTSEVNQPMVAVLYPVMAKVQSDAPRLRELYLRVLCWSAIICASTSVGIMMVAHDLVGVLLGAKWTNLEPLMGWLALAAGLMGLSSGAYTTFDALGVPQRGAHMQWLRLFMLCIAIAPVAILTRNLELIAVTRFVVTLIFTPTLFFAVGRTIGVSPRDYGRALWRPFAAAGLMAFAILVAKPVIVAPEVIRLGLTVFVGVAVFTMSLLLLWWASGRPEAAEKDLLTFLWSLTRRPASVEVQVP